jgi:membrane protein
VQTRVNHSGINDKHKRPRIEEIVSGPPQGLFTLAVLATIWTASSMVEGTRTILNRAYHVSTPPAYIWRRLLSIAQFLLMTIATFIAMSFLVVVPVLWKAIEKILELPHDMLSSYWTYIRYGISIFVLAMVVAGSYHILPNIKQRFSAVLPGTFVVIVLWALFALGFAAYLQSFRQVNFIYGSLEGIIVALLFFYISSIIYIFGAELNYQIERALGHRVVQKEAVAAKDSKTPTPRQAREDERIEKQKESGSTKKPARKKKAPTKKQKKKS